jgi:glutaredoxin-like YruB-family protein
MEKIRIFSQPTCPACNELKEYLKNKGIEFEDYNILEDNKALEEMLHVHKVRVTPLLIIGNDRMIGFNPDELESLLAKHS